MKKISSFLFLFSLLIMAACAGNNTPPAASAADTSKGEDIYKRTCFICHQGKGEGMANTYPPLAKSDFLADRVKTIEQIIKGKTGVLVVNGISYNNTMPPQQLDDEEIAEVLTYVYSSFGNSGKPVTADEVKAVRAGIKDVLPL